MTRILPLIVVLLWYSDFITTKPIIDYSDPFSALALSVSNFYQATGGCFFHILVIIFFSEPYIDFSRTFIVAMSHQIFLVSFGAFTILMFLIKKNSASKTVSIFFLIPATSAFMAWVFLSENLTNLDLIGFLITTIGIYIATRD